MNILNQSCQIAILFNYGRIKIQNSGLFGGGGVGQGSKPGQRSGSERVGA